MAMELNRRNFVKGAACAAGMGALAVAPALATEAAGASDGGFTFADTVAWNAEYDVVVVGYGTAGGTAAVYAADNGAHVLLCDAAPEGEEGGNSRVACQMMVAGDDPEKMFNTTTTASPGTSTPTRIPCAPTPTPCAAWSPTWSTSAWPVMTCSSGLTAPW